MHPEGAERGDKTGGWKQCESSWFWGGWCFCRKFNYGVAAEKSSAFPP